MARLTKEEWEQARAEYEVRGASLGEISRKFGVSKTAVRKKVSEEDWAQGKSSHLVKRKVAAIKEITAVTEESSHLPETFRHTLETMVQEELQAQGIMATARITLATRVIDLAKKAQTPEAIETLSRAHKNLSPPVSKDASTTVNVNQQQAQGVRNISPRDALAEITRQAMETDGE